MPLLSVEALIEQLRQLPPKSYVAIEGPDGALTTDIAPPKVETLCLTIAGDNVDQDEQTFIDEFQIFDVEWRVFALRLGHTPADPDQDPAHDQ